jgi:PHP family Zn ribbon phosphoesterase
VLEKIRTEFAVLLDAPPDDIEKAGSPLLKEAIVKMRKGDIHIAPGYDGEFGKIKIFKDA